MRASSGFALCQCEPSPPDTDLLESAFEQARGLSALDARLAVRQGCGILADRLERETASGMNAHLTNAGYRSAVVAETELHLPRPFHLRRADISPATMIVYDVYGRPRQIAWKAILVAHAGTYPEGRFATTQEAGWEFVGDMTVAWDAEHEYVETDTMALELIVGDPRERFTANPSPFDYRYLADRKRTESRENFALLLEDVARAVYDSIPWLSFRPPGDGASLTKLRRYPSRRLFERHLAWLTWYASRPGPR